MVSCCARVLGLRWRKNVDSARGLRPKEFLSGMTGNCFFVFFFFYEIFLFPFFETLNGTRRLPLSESREISPFFCWNWNPCFVCKGSLLVTSEPSSFASSPKLRKISGLAVPPSTHFFAATGILWFDWPINLSSFKMKGWLLPF